MKNIYSIALRSVIVAFALVGLISCVRYNPKECVDPRGNVRLVVAIETEATPVRSSSDTRYQIENTVVYVFDADNKYVTSCRGEQSNGEPYEFFLTLEDGYYSFIVWTNFCDIYRTNKTLEYCDKNAPAMEDLEFFYDHSAHECQTSLLPDLLYGSAARNIIADINNNINVSMHPDTYTINFKVTGLSDCEDNFSFSVTDNNSHYKFDNSIIDGKDNFKHIRTCQQIGGELNASIKTLRLTKTRSPLFVFENTTSGDVLYSDCLIQTILNAYKSAGQTVDFEETFTYDITLSYDVNMDLTISVNGWNYTPKDIEF